MNIPHTSQTLNFSVTAVEEQTLKVPITPDDVDEAPSLYRDLVPSHPSEGASAPGRYGNRQRRIDCVWVSVDESAGNAVCHVRVTMRLAGGSRLTRAIW